MVIKLLTSRLAGLLVTIGLAGIACSTSNQVRTQYDAAVQADTGQATTFLFVIDGLSIRLLKSEFERNNLSFLRNHFLKSNQFNKARSVFPSLTYPNLVSILTEKPVSQHGIYGNKVFIGGQNFNFEEPGSHRFLNEKINNQNIFYRLERKGLRTVSIGYNFWNNASSATNPVDLNAGAQILEKNYRAVDEFLIDSLYELLKETEEKRWPDFVFVHLIGLDLTSHDYGPDSAQAQAYLNFLDQKLGPVLQLIEVREAQQKRKVVSLLTSDHGFSAPVQRKIQIPSALKNENQIRTFNEGRLASFKFPDFWDENRRKFYIEKAAFNQDFLIKAWRQGNTVQLQTSVSDGFSKSQKFSVRQLEFPLSAAGLSDPVFSLILDYFNTSSQIDLVLLTSDKVAFNQDYKGFHGGVSEDEILVPLLIRNGRLKDETRIPFLYEILRFL